MLAAPTLAAAGGGLGKARGGVTGAALMGGPEPWPELPEPAILLRLCARCGSERGFGEGRPAQTNFEGL